MPAETYRFVIQGVSTGEQTQNVLHFIADNNDDSTPLALASELVNHWHTNFLPLWLDFQSNRYVVRWIEAKRILPAGGNSYWKEYPEGVQVGDINAEQGVLQLAPIVKLFCGLDSSIQGRTFLPPPADTSVAANVIDSAYSTDALQVFTAMLSFSDTHDWQLAVYSKATSQAIGVTTVAMSNIIGCQGRRRKPL